MLALSISTERLEFLANLSVLLNSALGTRQIIRLALEHLQEKLSAAASTIFFLNDSGQELSFWAFQGESSSHLQGRNMPSAKGIVGWVMQNQKPQLVDDVSKDDRFYPEIDKLGTFRTKSIICVPLVVKGRNPIGALEVLNRTDQQAFTPSDLLFVQQFGHQVALAIDNARLYEEIQQRYDELLVTNREKNNQIAALESDVAHYHTLVSKLQQHLVKSSEHLEEGSALLEKTFITRREKQELRDALAELSEAYKRLSQTT